MNSSGCRHYAAACLVRCSHALVILLLVQPLCIGACDDNAHSNHALAVQLLNTALQLVRAHLGQAAGTRSCSG